MSAALDQAEAVFTVLYRAAVLAVVQERDAVAILGDVGPFVSADIELGAIKICVVVRAARDVTELDLVTRGVRQNIQRKTHLEELIFFFPVDDSFEIDSSGPCVKHDILHNGRLAPDLTLLANPQLKRAIATTVLDTRPSTGANLSL